MPCDGGASGPRNKWCRNCCKRLSVLPLRGPVSDRVVGLPWFEDAFDVSKCGQSRATP